MNSTKQDFFDMMFEQANLNVILAADEVANGLDKQAGPGAWVSGAMNKLPKGIQHRVVDAVTGFRGDGIPTRTGKAMNLPFEFGKGLGSGTKVLVKGVGALAPALAAAGLLYGVPTYAIHRAKKRRVAAEDQEIRDSFEDIMDNPEFEGLDKDLARRHFDTLATFAPTLASHPDVAQSYVLERMQDLGSMIHPSTFKDIVATEKGVQDAMTARANRGGSPFDAVIMKGIDNVATKI